MAKIKLDLISPDEFSAKSLHEKNDYLQDVAKQAAIARGLSEPVPLDRDSLSRLRRFYVRRRANELELDKTPDPELRNAIKGLANAIHLGEVSKLIAHETPSGGGIDKTLRDAPPDDAQLMFFVPTVHDAPLKDDVNLMDVAPFSLSKTVRQGLIRYELPDCVITIEGGAAVGLVTAYDYDIFIHMVSHLASEMRQYRHDMEKGLRPSLPPRTFRPSAADILRYCRREQGGKQYLELEKALDRLQATRYKITNLTTGNKRRASESFPLIGRYKVVSRTRMDRIDEIEIDIPEWVYNGVVTTQATPSILTLNRDYFLISRPLAKFIYRLARKACGAHGYAEYGLQTLYERSGSAMPFRKFRDAIRDLVAATKSDPLPDFDIDVVPGKGGDKLRMMDRRKQIAMSSAA
ncbi:replication initiator protein A [Hyphomicrobium sp. LHD-15]|uniref:replication initiator protein A n=1 Tax=Hyphomicrobium sp. LHD-15 TaxID=3072142 RepID=UPI00280EB17F|nr:replication initiator protein A [Hyphomicrobium sp. LHD-15]MDQ8699255.1 replication initiator protein A [Hyphomicrobium sp. LHD-15]